MLDSLAVSTKSKILTQVSSGHDRTVLLNELHLASDLNMSSHMLLSHLVRSRLAQEVEERLPMAESGGSGF